MGEMFAFINISLPEEFASLPFPGHVATDSRHVRTGGAFVALEGDRTDGHQYIPQALERGAALIVVRRGKRPDGISVPCVELEEPERDLAQMASAYLESAQIGEVIAVTGSVGKTTTRAALLHVLQRKFRIHSSARSLNTRIGCTCTVLGMPPDTELLLMEFGANKPGEIQELAELFPPTSVVITQVAPGHLEGFGSIEGVLKGKMEITKSRRLRRFLYNFDNLPLSVAASGLKADGVDAETYSVGNGEADFRIEALSFEMREGVPELSFKLKGKDDHVVPFHAGVWGTHLAYPLAFSAALGSLLGIPLSECAEALADFQGLEGRGRILSLEGGKRFLVDDAYNANPISMRASLETFAKLCVEGKMAVLGEMREMGPDALRYHRDLEPLLSCFNNIVLVGDIWHEAMSDFPGRSFVPDWRAALKIVRGAPWKGLLVKGSNSLGLGNIVRSLSGEGEGA